MIISSVLSILILVFSGFYINQENDEIKFPVEKSLAPTLIEVPPVMYAKTPGIVISGDYFIVMRSFSGNPIFSVFEMPGFRYLGDFGTFGKGPLEFGVPDVRTARATRKGFQLYDTRKGMVYIDMTDYSSNKSFRVNQIKLPSELDIINDVVQINDSIIFGMPYVAVTDKLYLKYNTHNNKTDFFGEYPAFFPKGNKDKFWGLIWRHSVVKPDGTKYASFFAYFKLFRIYNNSWLLLKEKTLEIPKNILSPKHKFTTYYDVTKATNKYIYALCLNGQLNETDNYPTLEVWDWDGNPVAKLKLQNFVFSFDVTQDNKKIYCMDREIDDKIFVYDLTEVLK